MTDKNKIGILIGALLLFIVYCILHYAGITHYFSLAQLKQHRTVLSEYVYAHYFVSIVWYIALYFLVATLALPFASLFTMIGGFLFGTLQGMLYTNIGATLGATAVFLLVRYYIGTYVQTRYQDQLRQFNDEFAVNGSYYLVSIRLISVVPFFMINVCAGLTNATLLQFMVTTSLGIIPGSFVYSYAGQQLMHINRVHDLVTLPVAFAFIGLSVISLLPVIIKKIYRALF